MGKASLALLGCDGPSVANANDVCVCAIVEAKRARALEPRGWSL